jgi:5-methylcytosine-specific restriction endonuclease McrA
MSAATQVILLDHNFQFLNVLSIKKAVKLMVKQRVEVISSTTRELHEGFFLPKVLRLLKAINATFNKKIPFSKSGVFTRDNYVCMYCGKHLNAKTATVDHVLPTSKGGKNNFLNCVTSCKPCNSWKSDKLLSQTNMQLIKHPTHPSFSEFMFMKMKSLGIDLKDIWH